MTRVLKWIMAEMLKVKFYQKTVLGSLQSSHNLI